MNPSESGLSRHWLIHNSSYLLAVVSRKVVYQSSEVMKQISVAKYPGLEVFFILVFIGTNFLIFYKLFSLSKHDICDTFFNNYLQF